MARAGSDILRRTFSLFVIAYCAVSAGYAGADSFYSSSFEGVPSVAAMTAIGRALFSDSSLSTSGNMSCATCHDPTRAYGPPESRSVAGLRAIPSLRYGQAVPPFTEHYYDAEGDDSIDQGPAGGRTWDGRTQSAHDQARLPLFSPQEMANTSEAAVVEKVQQAPYAATFRDTFGAHVFDDTPLAFKAVLLALEVFQQSPEDFYPYSSKYDAWLRGQTTLTVRERRGLDLFNNATKGDCARCHPSSIKGSAFPQFTDYGYVALGLPRNRQIAANADPQFFDLGLCGPLRRDLAAKTEYCGFFRTPTLRNVATRAEFFHNGAVHDLRKALRFYFERDTQPQRWYPSRDGAVVEFDDLPPQFRSNVEKGSPFGRHVRDAAVLSDAEIDDLIAFLHTLTDADATNKSTTVPGTNKSNKSTRVPGTNKSNKSTRVPGTNKSTAAN